jgi:DHA1 family inner membrane transport protein
MAFLRSAPVNLLNLHYAIHALALSGSGIFFAVFLLQAHVPAPVVMAALAAILLGRFCIRPFVVALAKRWGLKPLVIAGTLLTSLQYPLLARVEGVGPGLLALCIVASIGDTLYWTTYHAWFAALGDNEDRGHQIGAREAAATVAGILAPLATGWALVTVGPDIAFGVTALVLAAAALPLLAAPNVKVVDEAPGAFRAALPAVLLMAADSWSWAGYGLVWQIALFISLGRDFAAYGGAVALAALVGAVSGLAIGRWIDFGHGGRVLWLSSAALMAMVALRAASYGDPRLAVAASAVGALAFALHTPVVMTAIYNRSKLSPCPLRFHVATEAGWDLAGAAGCLAAGALLWAGAPYAASIALAALGVGASFFLLRRHYDEA